MLGKLSNKSVRLIRRNSLVPSTTIIIRSSSSRKDEERHNMKLEVLTGDSQIEAQKQIVQMQQEMADREQRQKNYSQLLSVYKCTQHAQKEARKLARKLEKLEHDNFSTGISLTDRFHADKAIMRAINKKKDASRKCPNCGEQGHRREFCPLPQLCSHCGGIGHNSRKCPHLHLAKKTTNRSEVQSPL